MYIAKQGRILGCYFCSFILVQLYMSWRKATPHTTIRRYRAFKEALYVSNSKTVGSIKLKLSSHEF